MKSRRTTVIAPSWRAVLSYVKSNTTIVGIDEVGRGAWAGPVVAAAVVLKPRTIFKYLRDSKKVTSQRRVALDRMIRREGLAVGIGWVSPGEVDAHGLSWAVKESGLRALSMCELETGTYQVILDGRHNYLKDVHPSVAIVRADAYVVPVAAASVVAKVARDRYMAALGHRYPDYGFAAHKGYGTKVHQDALVKLGATPAHRFSYAPVTRLTR
ncbi:MAG TPA: ribonuclease HII [Candidatus Saccharimonadia bacterium]|nr:ribonuclease HII [Candidatus Saccharimonadia bacterium]